VTRQCGRASKIWSFACHRRKSRPGARTTETLKHPIVAWITAGLCIQTRLSRHLYCEFAVDAVRNAFVDARKRASGATLLADLLRR
jgi:hypothetical protein